LFLKQILLIGALLAVGSCSTAKAESREEQNAIADHGAQKISSPVPRMLAIHAGYCSICHEMKPLVENIAAECNKKGLRVDLVDVSNEENEYLLEKYRVVALPTYLFIDAQGREVARLIGAQTNSAIQQALSALTGEQCPGLGRVRAKKAQARDGVSCRSSETDSNIAAKKTRLSCG
jgi:thiol:disulfide interchange protein